MCPRVAGEAVGTEEQAAVTITGVSQAAFPDHNVQYQFRTENNGGQVSSGNLLLITSMILCFLDSRIEELFVVTCTVIQTKLCNVHGDTQQQGRTGLQD